MRCAILVFALICISVFTIPPAVASAFRSPSYSDYFRSTYRSLDCLRSPDGLISDRGTLPQAPDVGPCRGLRLEDSTSPTNIGFDLLSQLAAIENGLSKSHALETISKIMDGISALERHPSNGLFFSWYRTSKPFHPTNKNVSSVDNIHLALALWTLAQRFPRSEIGKTAGAIFDSMDFFDFYRPQTGLMGGNLQFRAATLDEPQDWILESWNYSYFGSEARSIAAVGYALGKFNGRDFVSRNTGAYTIEFTDSPSMLRTWDGGVFQLLLPEILIGEDRYSPILKRAFNTYASASLGKAAGVSTDAGAQSAVSIRSAVPSAFSASQAGREGVTCGGTLSCYNGKAGSLWLAATSNADKDSPSTIDQWEAVFTPHAAFLTASLNPKEFASVFQKLSRMRDHIARLYDSEIGWMDGLRIKAPFKDSVVPVQLSLDQEMLLLALSKILAKDGQTASARAIQSQSQSRARITEYYSELEHELQRALGHL